MRVECWCGLSVVRRRLGVWRCGYWLYGPHWRPARGPPASPPLFPRVPAPPSLSVLLPRKGRARGGGGECVRLGGPRGTQEGPCCVFDSLLLPLHPGRDLCACTPPHDGMYAFVFPAARPPSPFSPSWLCISPCHTNTHTPLPPTQGRKAPVSNRWPRVARLPSSTGTDPPLPSPRNRATVVLMCFCVSALLLPVGRLCPASGDAWRWFSPLPCGCGDAGFGGVFLLVQLPYGALRLPLLVPLPSPCVVYAILVTQRVG